MSKPYNLSNYAKRADIKALMDDLSPEDRKWHLCRRTGRSYADLVAVAASVSGDREKFEAEIGYNNLRRRNHYGDYGWWVTICAWMRLYIPEWESKFKLATKKIAEMALLPNADTSKILDVAAKALNIEPEILQHYSEHLDEIELFLTTQRRMLGVLAEGKLWEGIAAGDLPTVRWLLPRIKPGAYGGVYPGTSPADGDKKITIIDVEDE